MSDDVYGSKGLKALQKAKEIAILTHNERLYNIINAAIYEYLDMPEMAQDFHNRAKFQAFKYKE